MRKGVLELLQGMNDGGFGVVYQRVRQGEPIAFAEYLAVWSDADAGEEHEMNARERSEHLPYAFRAGDGGCLCGFDASRMKEAVAVPVFARYHDVNTVLEQLFPEGLEDVVGVAQDGLAASELPVGEEVLDEVGGGVGRASEVWVMTGGG